MSRTGGFDILLLCLQVKILKRFLHFVYSLKLCERYTLFTVENVPPPFVYKCKVENVGEGLGGPTCEVREPGHLEGFVTP